jgi:hypothetical protein
MKQHDVAGDRHRTAERAHVAAGRAGFEMSVHAPLRPDEIERLPDHFALLLRERRHRVGDVGECRLDAREMLLQEFVDGLVVAMACARVDDQCMKAILGIEVVDVLQEAVERVGARVSS